MRRFDRTAGWVAIALLGLLGAVGASWGFAQGEDGRDGRDSLYEHLTVFSEVLSLVQRAYVDETDVEVLFAAGLEGIVDALDAQAIYVPVSGVEVSERARRIGIAHSGVTVVKQRGIAYVLAVDPASPGAEAGLLTGDLVTSIDGVGTRRMPLWQIRDRLAARPGTRLALEILRRGTGMEVSLALASYPSPGPTLEHRDGIPILRIGSFEPAAVETLRELLLELTAAGQARLIVDLRNTAGGESASAYAVGGLFARGELGRLMKRQEIVDAWDGAAEPIWSGRLLVLTNRGSQGAAEILAQILVQSAAAERVGERTFGHAGREIVRELPNGDRLVLTDAFFTGPDGRIIDHGLEPQIPVTEASRSLGETELSLDELILERALEELRSEEDAARRVA